MVVTLGSATICGLLIEVHLALLLHFPSPNKMADSPPPQPEQYKCQSQARQTDKSNMEKVHWPPCVIAQFLSWLHKWHSNGRLCRQHGNNSTRHHLGMSLTPNVSDVLSSRVSLASGYASPFTDRCWRPVRFPYCHRFAALYQFCCFFAQFSTAFRQITTFHQGEPNEMNNREKTDEHKRLFLWTISNLAKSQMTALLCASVP